MKQWCHPLALTVLIAAVADLGCMSNRPHGLYSNQYRIDARLALDRVSISSKDVPLSVLLADLRVNHGVEVRLNEAVDPRVTVDVKDVPLDEALSRIVPAGVRYVLRLGDRDVAWDGAGVTGGEKKGGAVTIPRDLPRKGEHTAPRGGGALARKAPTDTPLRTPQYGETFKPNPLEVAKVPLGEGPKRPVAQTGHEGRSVQLRFAISRQNGVSLQSATVIDGDKVESNFVHGPLLMVVRDRTGAIAAFDTLPDPLEEHAYREDGRHGVARADEGTFGVRLPSRFANHEIWGGLTLEFLDARDSNLPAVLDAKSLLRVIDGARPLGRVEGNAIAAALRASDQHTVE